MGTVGSGERHDRKEAAVYERSSFSCTLKPASSPSNTEALAEVVMGELRARGVEVELIHVADLYIPPGVETEVGPGDDWPQVHRHCG
jgi:multimeric flavodoxin WrbA